jgi:hypothetical protein
MKFAVAALALLAILPGGQSSAHESRGIHLNPGFNCDEPMRWAPRHSDGQVRLAITTREGKVTLVLTDRVVAFQLSDRVMRKIDRELHRARHEADDDGPLGETIKSVVLTTVRTFLDHSAECPVNELRDVRYANGRLEFVTRGGERIFSHFEIDDTDVLESFDPNDAALFVREFHRVQGAGR